MSNDHNVQYSKFSCVPKDQDLVGIAIIMKEEIFPTQGLHPDSFHSDLSSRLRQRKVSTATPHMMMVNKQLTAGNMPFGTAILGRS